MSLIVPLKALDPSSRVASPSAFLFRPVFVPFCIILFTIHHHPIGKHQFLPQSQNIRSLLNPLYAYIATLWICGMVKIGRVASPSMLTSFIRLQISSETQRSQNISKLACCQEFQGIFWSCVFCLLLYLGPCYNLPAHFQHFFSPLEDAIGGSLW